MCYKLEPTHVQCRAELRKRRSLTASQRTLCLCTRILTCTPDTHAVRPRWCLSDDFGRTLNRKRTTQFTPCKARACNVVDATYVFVLKDEKKSFLMRVLQNLRFSADRLSQRCVPEMFSLATHGLCRDSVYFAATANYNFSLSNSESSVVSREALPDGCGEDG